MSHKRRWAIGGIFALAVICGFVAIMSTWVRRQALDTNNWTNTSSQLLADKKVQNAVGLYMVDQLFSSVDVAGELRAALPPQAQAVAAPAAAGLRELANRAAPELLARPRVQDAWQIANRNAHKQLLQVLNGGSKTVSTSNGEVVLDLHALVDQLAGRLGVGQQVAAARAKVGSSGARGAVQQRLGVTLPPSSGRLVILRSKQLKTAQDIAKGIRHLSIIFTVLAFGLFALAIWLARPLRRLALRTTGWCFFGLGVACLLIRRIAGNWIVTNLVKSESVRPAAHDTWDIGTSLLRAIALAFVVYGLVIVIAAVIAGPSRPAHALRHALAPTLRDRPLVTWGTATLVYLVVLAWGPTPALRHIVPILIIAALLALGIELLRRQTAREYPDARAGDATRRARAWFDARRGRPDAHAAPQSGAGNGGRLGELERLASLHDSGALTDEEYTTQKGLLLSG
jgi:hypothetical protein